MSKFEVTITETVTAFEAPVDPHELTPDVRGISWTGDAADNDAAKEAAYLAWDEKYGSGKQPVAAIVKITPV